MFRHVPNALTGGRLVLAAIFFALLGIYQYQGRGSPGLLNIAFGLYVIALVTDFLDGYLARKWKVEGAFGRVVDPFVDKVLVIGTFIFFAGKNFIIPAGLHEGAFVVKTITGVAPWMVVVILARELLVTSFRGLSEGSGQNFGAAFSGKLKMGFQSGAILAILVYVNYRDPLAEAGYLRYAGWVRDFGIWGTLVITVASGLLYVQKAVAVYRKGLKALKDDAE
ncbi:MAG TPA: CDP-alcohol phosphatidyltransferase family protein [Tepidisphaeraceae bacterium]|jgi:CDP-diacylglycerol--glycerol-3-phosphate 3-phosphatidyltransferase|nr:CDP-alcohol phosphatidyltransferase family protein [Tepidisphaeraceae bacterium]